MDTVSKSCQERGSVAAKAHAKAVLSGTVQLYLLLLLRVLLLQHYKLHTNDTIITFYSILAQSM